MVIIMDMDSGRVIREAPGDAYGDEVLNAGWAEVPQVAPRLAEVASTRQTPGESEIAGFLARLYAAQE
ncbi:MAG: hypothetical protein L6Q60_01690 [Rhodocyclaceae bacterium]|nr:hypothetical protein [Rhodocyclaceae bacterium]